MISCIFWRNTPPPTLSSQTGHSTIMLCAYFTYTYILICISSLLFHWQSHTCPKKIPVLPIFKAWFFLLMLWRNQNGNHLVFSFVVRIHIIIQHTSLTYHTHIHTQTHNMDESIYKYMCTTIENVMRKIYYHKTRDAYTYSQAKPTPLRKSRSMLTRHHSSKLH